VTTPRECVLLIDHSGIMRPRADVAVADLLTVPGGYQNFDPAHAPNRLPALIDHVTATAAVGRCFIGLVVVRGQHVPLRRTGAYASPAPGPYPMPTIAALSRHN
jgi:hypothetical protein